MDPTNLHPGSITRCEIAQQPEVWQKAATTVGKLRAALDGLSSTPLADPRWRIVCTGSGSSAYAAAVIAPTLSLALRRHVEAVATSHIVATPDSLDRSRPVLMVSFARSGDSPESAAAVELAGALCPAVRHLAITCNPYGQLATLLNHADAAEVLLLPAESHDRGFAMTSSFTTMALAGLLAFGVKIDIEGLATAGRQVLALLPTTSQALARNRPKRLVFLGSGALARLAKESALKCVELTGGQVVAIGETSMGFRHGPKAILDKDTIVIIYLSACPYTRAYDEDVAQELISQLGTDRVVVIDPRVDWTLKHQAWPVHTADRSDSVWGLAGVIYAQSLACESALVWGRDPDNPFPDGTVNRVVQGVRIHPFVTEGGQR